nr:hypothetical protein [Tanacetum cinerariifolium]
MNIQDMELQKQQYLEEMQSMINQIQIEDYRNERIDVYYKRECEIKIDELKDYFKKISIEIEKITKEKEIRKQDQAANLSTYIAEHSRRFNFICYDDDDEEKTIPLRDIISQLHPYIVITNSHLVLPIEDPEDYLITRNGELSTIPKKESVLHYFRSQLLKQGIPSESEDTSGSDSECDLPSCDDFSPVKVLEGKSVTFSNPLFDSNDDFTSSDDESLSNEDVPKDNVKIYSNPLFEFDDKYIFGDVNPLFNEVLEDIESKASYDSNLDEPNLCHTLPRRKHEV